MSGPLSPTRGILLKLVSVGLFIAMSGLVKYASQTVPPGQAVFFRSLFALPVVLGWLLLRGELGPGLRTRRPLGHLWRGLAGACAMGCMFGGLALLPLPEVTAIFYTTPLFITVLAALFLGERIRAFRILTIAVGVAGVALVMAPRLAQEAAGSGQGQALGAILVLIGAFMAAVAQITIRALTRTEHVAAIVFYFSLTTTLLALLTAPFGWVWPDIWTLAALVGSGIVGGFAQICLTAAYRHADAAVIASFDFMSIVLAIIVGYFIFSEVPTPAMLGGAALVVGAGLALAWRERTLAKS